MCSHRLCLVVAGEPSELGPCHFLRLCEWAWPWAACSCPLASHKATQPTCPCLSLLTSLPSSSANHLLTSHLGTGQGAGLLTDTDGIPGHMYLSPPHTHSMCPPYTHTQRARQTWGACHHTWIGHTHTEERWLGEGVEKGLLAHLHAERT